MTTLNLAIHSICQSVQRDFKSLDEYGQNVKENAAKCSAMGYDISDWLLSSMFRMGLHIELESYSYIFHLAQEARSSLYEDLYQHTSYNQAEGSSY